jgi:hypothetical protein
MGLFRHGITTPRRVNPDINPGHPDWGMGVKPYCFETEFREGHCQETWTGIEQMV